MKPISQETNTNNHIVVPHCKTVNTTLIVFILIGFKMSLRYARQMSGYKLCTCNSNYF